MCGFEPVTANSLHTALLPFEFPNYAQDQAFRKSMIVDDTHDMPLV